MLNYILFATLEIAPIGRSSMNADQFEVFAWYLDDWTASLTYFTQHLVQDCTLFIPNFKYRILYDVAPLDECSFIVLWYSIRGIALFWIAKDSHCLLLILWDEPQRNKIVALNLLRYLHQSVIVKNIFFCWILLGDVDLFYLVNFIEL